MLNAIYGSLQVIHPKWNWTIKCFACIMYLLLQVTDSSQLSIFGKKNMFYFRNLTDVPVLYIFYDDQIVWNTNMKCGLGKGRGGCYILKGFSNMLSVNRIVIGMSELYILYHYFKIHVNGFVNVRQISTGWDIMGTKLCSSLESWK